MMTTTLHDPATPTVQALPSDQQAARAEPMELLH